MKKLFDLSAKVGEYTNQSGETKSKYRACGSVMEGEYGQFILFDKTFNPAGVNNGKDSCMIYMFEPKENQNAAPQQNNNQAGFAGPANNQNMQQNNAPQNNQQNNQNPGF